MTNLLTDGVTLGDNILAVLKTPAPDITMGALIVMLLPPLRTTTPTRTNRYQSIFLSFKSKAMKTNNESVVDQ